MATITQAQLQDIFKKADRSGQKLDRAEIVQELVNRGNTIEGLNDPTPPKPHGFFSTVAESLTKRNQSAFGTDTGLLEAARNPSSIQPSATQRFMSGQQGVGSTALQIAGQGAGAIGDLTGAALSLGGRVVSAVTPDAIEKPVVDTAKSAGLAILQSPVGQAGLAALQKGAAAYEQWKQTDPVTAANLEAVVNIASIIPVGKAATVGKQALSGVDDAAKGLIAPLRESAEASVSRVLNPTTNATKQTTQKLAPELVSRPLKDTLAITRKGMQDKAGAAAQVAGEAIQQAGPLPGKTPTSELINYLQAQKQQFIAGGKVISREGVESVDEVTRLIEQYGTDVDNEVLRDIRKIFDAEYYQGKKNIAKSAAETSTLNFKKQAADKIRGILAEQFPDIAELNKEYTFWSGLENVLSKTTARRTGQKGAIKAVAAIGGGIAGAPAGMTNAAVSSWAFRTVAGLVDSPAWGFVSAKIKDRLATALANSDLAEIGNVLGILPQQLLMNSAKEE